MTQPPYEVETNPGTTHLLPGPPMPLGYDQTGRPAEGGERDRLWIHLVWEAVLGVAVVVTFAVAASAYDELTSAPVLRDMALGVAILGLIAAGLSFSVRAAAPNLAVGAIVGLAGYGTVRLIEDAGWAATPAVLVVMVAAAATGVAMWLLVGLLNLPAWAVTLGAGFLIVGVGTAMMDNKLLQLTNEVDVRGSAYLWAGLFVVLSVAGGALWLVGPVRRALSGTRHEGDPARRPPIGGLLGGLLALMVSSVLAALAGSLAAFQMRAAVPFDTPTYLTLALAAVLIGGVSIFGRRAGVFGTVLGVVLVIVVERWLLLSEASSATWLIVVSCGVLLGLVLSRVLEFAGRKRG